MTQSKVKVTSLSVFFCTISKKTGTTRITKLDAEMFHDESWKLIYFGVKRSKAYVTSHKKHCRRGSLHSCECWLRLFHSLFLWCYRRSFVCSLRAGVQPTLDPSAKTFWTGPMQPQPGDLVTSICFGSHVSAADTLMLLIKSSATVTVYAGHRRTLLPARVNSLFITCLGIIWNNSLV